MTGPLTVALTPGSLAGGPPRAGHAAALLTATADGIVLGRTAPVGDAQVAAFPFELASVVATPEDRDALTALVAGNAAAGLRTIVCLDHDYSRPVDLGQPDAVVLRTSMQASATYAGEHAMPPLVEDPWAGATPEWRPWRRRPGVGFMGQVNAGATHRLAGHTPGAPPPEGHWLAGPREPSVFPQPVDVSGVIRSRALAGLAGSAVVDASVVVRDQFHGNVDDAGERARRRVEYAAHLAASDYVLCVRGAGNYSIRLFETMAMGRVPVIVETDLVLPCADVVDWDGLAVRVPLSEITRVDVHVAAAHDQGPEAFARRQLLAREAYVQWLCAEGFARYVADVILADLKSA